MTSRQLATAIGGVLALVGCVAFAVSRSGRDKPGANRESHAADADVKRSTSQGDTKTGKPGNTKAGTNSSTNPAPATAIRPQGARIAMVVAHQNFWYPDVVPVKRVFDEAGAKVTIASSAIGLATPDPRSAGEPVEADVAVHDLSADKFDAIVICGGEGVSEFYNTEPAGRDLKRLLADMLRQGKCVSALCAGPAVLADADILKGVEVTGFSSIKPKLAARGAVYVDEPVKTSGQIVTARNWEYADEFARTVLEWLANKNRR